MNSEVSSIKRLQSWYSSMCDGDWHHTYGVSISNIDNPGWYLEVDLADTYLYTAKFEEVVAQRNDEDDWLNCKVEEGKFKAVGGPHNLDELIRIFLDWSENAECGC